MTEQTREKVIVRTSFLGIVANIALAAFKAAVGILSHSVAVVLDAVNNLTDALSSVVTIIGAKLAGKPADKKHPFGHGRAEYLSALAIAFIILYAGLTSLVESVKKIMQPTEPDYSATALIIIAAAVLVKIALGLYVRASGKKADSDSLVASGQDALMDSVISLATLVAAAVYTLWGFSLEAYLGLVISLAIIKAGGEVLSETLSKILGERVDASFATSLKKTIIAADNEIHGVFDLIMNDYGPGRHIASVHIEVPDTWTADRIDRVTRKITNAVYEQHGVAMAAVGVYSINTKNDAAAKIHAQVSKLVLAHEGVMQIHGFFVDEETKQMRFDVMVAFGTKRKEIYKDVIAEIQQAFPDYNVQAQLDSDISD